MPGPKATPVHLTLHERTLLQKIIKRHTAPQRLARRAQMILLAGQGQGNTAIAAEMRLAVSTVENWRRRWIRSGSARAAASAERGELARVIEQILDDAPRSGAPVRFSAEALAQIIAVACQEPERFGRPVTHWTPSELADEVVQQGIVERISPRSVGRFLKRSRP